MLSMDPVSEHDALRVACRCRGRRRTTSTRCSSSPPRRPRGRSAPRRCRSAAGSAGDGCLSTLINVGELGPGEERFPTDENYAVDEHARSSSACCSQGQPYFNAVDDPASEPARWRAARAGKDSEVAVPIVVEAESWGEVWAATAPGRAALPGHRRALPRGDRGPAGGRDRPRRAVLARLAHGIRGPAHRAWPTGAPRGAAASAPTARGERGGQLAAAALRPRQPQGDQRRARPRGGGPRAEAAWPRRSWRPPPTTPAAWWGASRATSSACCSRARTSTRPATSAALRCEPRRATATCRCRSPAAPPPAAPATRTREQLLRAADAAQYAAKRKGGGQVCTAAPGRRAELRRRAAHVPRQP